MNHGSIITITIALLFTSQLVTAGEITDTYTTGETLTTTTLDNIKTAVNDNDTTKQDRVTGTCTAGQSIRVINANGTVTCEVDSNTTYSGGSGITISGTTISKTTQTDTYYIAGSDFQPVYLTDDTEWNAYDLSGQYGFPLVAGTQYVGHGVRLPNGATITEMRCGYYDNHATYDITAFSFALYSRLYTSTSAPTVVNATNATTTGQSSVIQESIVSGLTLTVNNATTAYNVLLRLGASTGYTATSSSSIRTYGCRITYTH